jgi:hypothetical protein
VRVADNSLLPGQLVSEPIGKIAVTLSPAIETSMHLSAHRVGAQRVAGAEVDTVAAEGSKESARGLAAYRFRWKLLSR